MTLWRSRSLRIALAVGLVLRVLVVAVEPDYRPVADPSDYLRHALVIADTGSFPVSLTPGGGPTAYRGPVYPLFLGALFGLTGDSVTAARVAQGLLGVLSVWLVALLVFRLWGLRAGQVAAWLAALFAPFVALGSTLLSEVVLVPLELGALLCALAARDSPRRARLWGLAAGALTGAAALAHANAILLAIPVLALILRRRDGGRRVAPALAALAATAALIGAWAIRNASQFDAFVPLSTAGGPTLAGTYNATTAAQRELPGNWTEYWRDPTVARALARAGPGELAVDRATRDAAIAYATDHPGYIAEVVWWNARRMVGLNGSAWAAFDSAGSVIPRWLWWAGIASFWLLVPFAVVGLLTRASRGAPAAIWLAPVLMLASVLPLVGYTRMRAAADPFLIALAALGMVALARRARARWLVRSRARLPPVGRGGTRP